MTGKYTTAKVMIDNVEESCISQITSFINHPAFTNPISIMPDTHWGKGAVIGFTMPMTQKIIPNVIGVDIGCGMLSQDLGEKLSMSYDELDKIIRDKIPFGSNMHDKAVIHLKKDFPWNEVRKTAKDFTNAFNVKFNTSYSPEIYEGEEKWFQNKCKQINANERRIINSIGTLGGGNHFIEIGKDDIKNHFWLTIHTGSRNFGKCVCEYWQYYATKIVRKGKDFSIKTEIENIRKTYTGKDIESEIRKLRNDAGTDNVKNVMDYLEDEDAMHYLADMIFAQKYAEVNRKYIADIICDVLDSSIKSRSDLKRISCVHNFIDFRDFIVRKGAIRSYTGEEMIIPFNMHDGLLFCKGKSNSEWNYSAPHGAGRVYSRAKAKQIIDVEKFKDSMKDIYSTSVGFNTLDEAPEAYKNSKMIEEAIEPTAEIIMRVKPVMNMKDAKGDRE